ncbi:MAG: hypothetical protein NC305_05090 [Lachnospiraceae bacterium]|nr:hypothetical protein [Muribaculum sp.]MCM1409903.1 hypothetical protein [Lachnospiraceae bacterium]
MKKKTRRSDKKIRSEKARFVKVKSAMQKVLTKRNQQILYVITIIMVVLSLLDIFKGIFPRPVSIAIYVCAAVSFFPSCALWVRTIHILVKVVLIPFTERNKIIHVLIKDYRLRSVVMALPGLGINMVFAIFNAVIGITSRSAWYGSLAAYYILLCAMRFISVMYAKRIYIDKKELSTEQRELNVYRNCGRMLSVMSIALMGAVTMVVSGGGGKTYHGLMIYAVAAYTFYKLVMSILGMVRARKEKSLLLITMRNIGHSEALVALLSLQTALFAAFGQDSGEMVPIMNAATGAAVCFGALILGLHMIYDARKRMRLCNTDFKGGISNDSHSGCR